MSKLEEKISAYQAEAKKLSLDISDDLIAKVTRALGPSIYNKDSEGIACSQKGELETVKNYMRKKFGLSDDSAMDAAIQEVCEKMGSKNPSKKRALFYALLAKKFGKESVYA